MAWIRCTGNTGGSLKVRTASGRIATFDTNMADVLQEVKCEITATGGNGTPDNPIPINGYTEANITRCGANLVELSDDTKNDSQGCAVDYINNGVKITASNTYARVSYVFPTKVGQTYTLSYYGYGTGNFIQTYYNDQSVWNPQSYGRQQITSTRTKYTKTFTATSDTFFVGFYVTTSGTTGDMVIEDFMLEVGSSASDDFHPYNGQTYAVSFGQVVYGGVLDVTRGKLTVDCARATVDLSQYTPTTANGYDSYLLTLTDLATDSAGSSDKKLCNVCERYSWSGSTVGYEHFYIGGANAVIYLDENTYRSGIVEFSYPLATPFDIDLTPVQIEQLLGKNNVWHDANGDTEVKHLEVVRN